jgi:hypothetical protein
MNAKPISLFLYNAFKKDRHAATSLGTEQDEIAEILVKCIKGGQLEFARNNRKCRRAIYTKIVRKHNEGQQILLTYLYRLACGVWISSGAVSINLGIAPQGEESTPRSDRMREEIASNMQFIKRLVARKE